MKKIYRKIISIILVISIFFSFMLNVRTSHVYASAVATIGSAKLLEFLLICAMAGVTFKAVDEAQELLDEFNASEFRFLDEEPERPDPNEPDPRTKKVILTMLGVNTGISVVNLARNVKGFFDHLNSREGDNRYLPGTYMDFEDFDYTDPKYRDEDVLNEIHKKSRSLYEMKKNNVDVGDQFYFSVGTIDFFCIFEENPNGYGYRIRYRFSGTDEGVISGEVYTPKKTIGIDLDFSRVHHADWRVKSAWYTITLLYNNGYGTYYEKGTHTFYRDGKILHPGESSGIEPFKYIDYYVEPESYITGEKDLFRKYPNLKNLLKNLDKVKKVVNPNGQIQHIYHGTTDDLIQDIAENTTIDDFYTDEKQEIEPISEEKIIIDSDVDPDELPYPEPTPEPEETPKGLGKIISLLQSIINWLSRIFRTIGDFFTIPEGVNIDFEPLKNTGIKEVFPFCIPFDFYESIKLFAKEAQEPEFHIYMDTEYFTVDHTVDIGFMRFYVGFLRYIVVIYFSWILMNKTRDMMKW